MKILIVGIEFDHHRYDKRDDVLHLNVGAPRKPAETCETPEGHGVEYDGDGNVIGLVLLNVKQTLEREGKLPLTWPKARIEAKDLKPALGAAAVKAKRPRPKAKRREIRVGDSVIMHFGGNQLPGKVVEDRGFLGRGGKRILRIAHVPTGSEDQLDFEMPEDNVELVAR